MDACIQKLFKITAGGFPQGFDLGPALAKYNRFLGRTFDIDGLVNFDTAIGTGLPLLRLHGRRIRQFLAKL